MEDIRYVAVGCQVDEEDAMDEEFNIIRVVNGIGQEVFKVGFDYGVFDDDEQGIQDMLRAICHGLDVFDPGKERATTQNSDEQDNSDEILE